MSIAPISPVGAAVRVQLLAAAQAELMAVVGVNPDGGQKPQGGKPQGQKPPERQADGQAESAPSRAGPLPSRATPVAGPAVQATAIQGAATEAARAAPDTTTPSPPDPARLALAEAKVAAAARQGGAAPLFADLEQAFSAPATPAPVREAAAQLLGMRLAGPVTADSLRQAVARSGLFLEARLAADAQTQAQAPTATLAQPDLKSALLALRQVLAAAAPQVARADAPSTLTGAALPAAPAAPAQTPPPTLAAAAPPGGPPASQGAPPPVPTPASHAPPLLAGPEPPPEAAPREPAPQTAQAHPGPATPAQAAPVPRGPALPPPLRDAALAAQPPATPSLPATATAEAVVPALRHEVEQALARQTLHQLASAADGSPGAAWMFELPIATPQGTALAQFEIDRDGRGGGVGGSSAEGWGARFSIDVEPLGPVHVHISQTGQRTAATVWAERPESLLRLRAHGEELARELAGEVVFHPGAPRRPVPSSGRLLDQLS